ncbi:transcription factor SPN1 ASCRUDRAFT_75150 [Ascoidea rubescens DSM 1968]|uniref:TFIIS N-terminal domain-containing protein n=1 Tax=Ascoidea rubescens DSM 1968 TaxID=1344418 RepID=A0A1D2VJW8_9ASCO|nr:hypothetical protein ASCRUDRAFT_75150 [Ascoidea rubescens DSM 1968]ODV61893.1 hypothetical protein ASCRUDRAFT_75150 [Ascoidea rubescens DSM 1968]
MNESDAHPAPDSESHSIAEVQRTDAQDFDHDDLSEVDEDAPEPEEDPFSLSIHKKRSSSQANTQYDDHPVPVVNGIGVRLSRKEYGPGLSAGNQSYANTEEVLDSNERRKREYEEKLDAAVQSLSKKKKRKKIDSVDLEQQQDAKIERLKNEMAYAAEQDEAALNNKIPATNKLLLLPKVKEILLRADLADSILDNNLLAAIRKWLEPLPDASLPAFEIQKCLFDSISKLPIKTIHLQESGLGKVMLFYQKSKRVEPSLKRQADRLVGEWTRPIMNKSDSYKNKTIQKVDFDINKFLKRKFASQNSNQNSLSKSMQNKSTASNDKQNRKSIYEEKAEGRNRTVAPEVRTTAYRIAPVVDITTLNTSKTSQAALAGVGASLNKDEQFKRIKNKMQYINKKKARAQGGVSIEGRNLS